MGLALPHTPTSSPTNVWYPECLTWSQEGDGFPSISIVRSHRPSIEIESGRIDALVVENSNMKTSDKGTNLNALVMLITLILDKVYNLLMILIRYKIFSFPAISTTAD